MDIDDFISSNVDNYDNIRGYTMTSNKNSSKTVFMSLNKALVDYSTGMEQLNNISEKTIFKELVDSSQLSYVDKEDIQISRATDHEDRICLQHGNTNIPTLKSTPPQCVDDDVINIQLPYNPNIPMELKLWDGNFYSILLHRSLKHLVSNSKNIKDSLNFVVKYISNK